MSDIAHHKREIKHAENQIKYFNKRLDGVRDALDKATNKAVITALRNELNTLLEDIKFQQRRIRENEYMINQLRNGLWN